MRIISKGTLRDFWESHPDAEEPLLAWYRTVRHEEWDKPGRAEG